MCIDPFVLQVRQCETCRKAGGPPAPASLSKTVDRHRHHLPWRNLDLAVPCVPGQDLPMHQIIFGFVCVEDRKFPFQQRLLGQTHGRVIEREVQIVNR
jgi:hypothetical protein